jgi:putative NIF3 family GTP cyclohydrolase 1 type 2
LLAAARAAEVDVYLTADLRHHPASEFSEFAVGIPAGGTPTGGTSAAGTGGTAPALIDAAHWATEWPWLAAVECLLTGALDVKTRVSTLVTDAWTISEGAT